MAEDRRIEEHEADEERLRRAGAERGGADDESERRRGLEESKRRIEAAADDTSDMALRRGELDGEITNVPSASDVLGGVVRRPQDADSPAETGYDHERDYQEKNGPA